MSCAKKALQIVKLEVVNCSCFKGFHPLAIEKSRLIFFILDHLFIAISAKKRG